MRILVIEDEPTLRAQVCERLSREGFVIDGCGDGEEGLYLATEYPFDAAGLNNLPLAHFYGRNMGLAVR